jgi:hypothetical protein
MKIYVDTVTGNEVRDLSGQKTLEQIQSEFGANFVFDREE